MLRLQKCDNNLEPNGTLLFIHGHKTQWGRCAKPRVLEDGRPHTPSFLRFLPNLDGGDTTMDAKNMN